MKTKGEEFKERFGYSISQKRLMVKYGISRNNTKQALEQLREAQKIRRRKAKGIQKNKHAASKAHMLAKGKPRLKGKKQKENKKEEKKQ